MINKLKNKFHKLSDSKKSAIAFMIASYIHYAISFLVTPLFSRLLSLPDFGLVSTYNSWVEMIGPIATLSLYAGFYNVGMVDYEDNRDKFTSAMLGLSTVVAVITMSLFTVIQLIFPNVVKIPMILTSLMTVYFITYPAMRYWQARERFEYKYKKLFIVTVLLAILTPASGLLLVFLSNKNLGIARLIGTNIITITLGIILYIYIFKKGKCFFNKEQWKIALKFCLPLIPHYLAMHVLSASDKVMINSICGDSEAGIYGMAYTASMVITTAWTAINGSLSPYVLNKLKKKDYKNIGRVGTQCIIGFSILCILICIIAPEIILILGGEKYIDSINLLPPLLASVLFMEMYNLFSYVEFYYKKTKNITFATIIAAITNVVLNFIFIKQFGYTAAAYTTLICYIIYCIFHYINMKKIVKEKIYNIKLLTIYSIIYTLICFGCLLLYKLPVIRYGILLTIILICIIMNKKIIKIVKEIFNK